MRPKRLMPALGHLARFVLIEVGLAPQQVLHHGGDERAGEQVGSHHGEDYRQGERGEQVSGRRR